MATLFISSSKASSASSFSVHQTMSLTRHTAFSEYMMEESVDQAHAIITKWDTKSPTSLFHENRKEGREFLKCVKDLRTAMHFFLSQKSASGKLVLAQQLMQIAMKRLEKEFYQILSANRDRLDPDSVRSCVSGRSSNSDDDQYQCDVGSDEEINVAGESISEVERVSALAMYDLKAIADCMIGCGYGKECVKIYKIIRKSIVDEGLYRIGIERNSSSQISKMNFEALQHKIKHWLSAVRIAVKTLFNGERVLCDHVFSASDSIRESSFAEITREGAINLFKFPELVTRTKRSSPHKIFCFLDLYEAISDLLPEIELIFSFESTSAVRLQVSSSLQKLSEAVRATLSEFESVVQKDSSKTLVTGGGIHPLTESAMNYISSLANYSGVLSEILADWPLPVQSPFPESYFDSPKSIDNPPSAMATRLAWLILVLLCRLDCKAELYKDIGLSYLFLANNLHFVLEKVRTSNLRYLLGEEWISKHEKKVKQYSASYEVMGWTKVFSSLPENNSQAPMSPEDVKECFGRFNLAFEEAYRKQTSWVVQDGKLRDDIKVSIAKKLVTAYGEFYEKYLGMLDGERNLEVLVRFSPDDLGNYLLDLLHGTAISGSSSSSSSSSSQKSGRAR